ncbi:MAG: hypothetical protein WC604_00865 [Candidatus Gracilibacteria bacterium]
MTNPIKLTEEEFRKLPNKKWAEYYTNITGKPEIETWLQGMLYLTEVKGIDAEEAKKIMTENWDK